MKIHTAGRPGENYVRLFCIACNIFRVNKAKKYEKSFST
jgi:hypothetical protein